MGGIAVDNEGTIGRSEGFNQGAITSSGRCKVGNGFDHLILIGVIGRLESGTSRGGLQLPSFLVGSCEEFLEACPGLVVSWLVPPEFSAAVEEPGLEQDLERNFDKLGKGVGSISG